VSSFDKVRNINAVDLVVLALGALLAIYFLPESNVQSAGALQISGIFLTIALLGPVFIACSRDINQIFRVELLLLVGVFFWLLIDILQPGFTVFPASYDGVHNTLVSISLFAFGLLLGIGFWNKETSLNKGLIKKFPIEAYIFPAIIVCFILGMMRVIFVCGLNVECFVDGILAPRWYSVWRGVDFGSWDTILIRLRLLGYLVFPLTVLLIHYKRQLNWQAIVSLFLCVLFVLVLVQAGGRRQLGIIGGASMLVWLSLNQPLNGVKVLKALFGLFFLMSVMQFMLEVRNHGIGRVIDGEISIFSTDDDGEVFHVDRNFQFFSMLSDIVPELEPHTGFTGIYSIIGSGIPGSILPGKPTYNVIDFTKYLGAGRAAGWNWTCSAVCELYLIGGNLVVFAGGILFSFLASLGNRILRQGAGRESVIVYGIFVMVLFVGLRAMREIFIVGLILLAIYTLVQGYNLLFRRWKTLRSG
jgi:hypothetical protein